MNIGLDIRPSLVRPTGVGSYVLALAQRLPASAPDHRFYFFSASLRDRYPIQAWPSNVTLVDRRLPVRALNFAWNRLGWPSLDMLARVHFDLVHSPHPLLVPAGLALACAVCLAGAWLPLVRAAAIDPARALKAGA